MIAVLIIVVVLTATACAVAATRARIEAGRAARSVGASARRTMPKAPAKPEPFVVLF